MQHKETGKTYNTEQLVKILWAKGCRRPYFRYTDPATHERQKLTAKRVIAMLGADREADAEELRAKLEAKIILNQHQSLRENHKLTIRDLYEARRIFYRGERPGYLHTFEAVWKARLEEKFAHIKALELTSPYVSEYRAWAHGEDPGRWEPAPRSWSKSTINGDISALSGMYTYAKEEGRILQIPVKFRYYNVDDNVREGFLEQHQYDALVATNPALWLRTLLALGYNYGLRKGEMLALRVSQVDFLHQRLNLKRTQTKNKKPRYAILTPEVRQLLAACVEGKIKTDYVLTRDDKPNSSQITNTRYDWRRMITASGITIEGAEPGEEVNVLIHDMRRSAVRNMIRSGIPELVAMRISGHRTRTMLDRYNIGSEVDIAEAARKITQYADEQRQLYREMMEQTKGEEKGEKTYEILEVIGLKGSKLAKFPV